MQTIHITQVVVASLLVRDAVSQGAKVRRGQAPDAAPDASYSRPTNSSMSIPTSMVMT